MSLRAAVWTQLLLLCMAGCAGTDEPSDLPPGELVVHWSRTKLDNGLEVAVLPHAGAPVVTAMIAVRSGAFIETPEQSGYSHLLEHMMFTGAQQWPEAEAFEDELLRIGAISNATTGPELVTYFHILPRARAEDGVALLSAALREPLLDPMALSEQIRVVLAEFDQHESSWEARQERWLPSLLFPGQPNRFDALGRRDVVAAATPESLRALHATYYMPNNALLLLIGDISPASGTQLAQQYFGDWARGPEPFPSPLPAMHAPLPRSTAELLHAPVSSSTLLVGWQGPDPRSDFRGVIAADLLAELSSLASAGFREVIGAPAVLGGGIRHLGSAGQGRIVASLGIGLGSEAEAVYRLRRVLTDLSASITEDELLAAKDAVWSKRFHSTATSLQHAFALAGDWSRADLDRGTRYLDELYELERDDLVALLANYVTSRPHAAMLLTSPSIPTEEAISTLGQTW